MATSASQLIDPTSLPNRTDPLSQNFTVVGPIAIQLQVSSSGTDCDFVVKLIGEEPSSAHSPDYQQLVRGEPMSARFRNFFANPEALQPNAITAIKYTMPDINHTFPRGHRWWFRYRVRGSRWPN